MLSQAAGYAVLALGYVAGNPGKSSLVKEISRSCEIPGPYLAKIVNALSRAKIVNTQRGVGGGVALARPPAEISLYEICTALDDPVILPRCMLGTAECSDQRACPAHQFWSAQRAKQTSFLRETTLFDIANFEAKRRARDARLNLERVSDNECTNCGRCGGGCHTEQGDRAQKAVKLRIHPDRLTS